jgi:hypothetical protein
VISTRGIARAIVGYDAPDLCRRRSALVLADQKTFGPQVAKEALPEPSRFAPCAR